MIAFVNYGDVKLKIQASDIRRTQGKHLIKVTIECIELKDLNIF